MKHYIIRFTVAPSYRKVIQTVVQASDKRQARILLNRSQSKGKKVQVLSIKETE